MTQVAETPVHRDNMARRPHVPTDCNRRMLAGPIAYKVVSSGTMRSDMMLSV